MKYFLDIQFIEGYRNPFFGKRKYFIDLISIGVVNEHGDGYYAISTEFRKREANPWVKENVLPHLYPKTGSMGYFWKTNRQIRNDLLSYFNCFLHRTLSGAKWASADNIEMYGYNAHKDWLVLCSLFGSGIDLMDCFPNDCIDLKQLLYDKVKQNAYPGSDLNEDLKAIKQHPRYPVKCGDQNARKDAEWNLELYSFIEWL